MKYLAFRDQLRTLIDQGHFQDLTDPAYFITITKVERTTKSVSTKKEYYRHSHRKLYLDGEYLGWACKGESYPNQITIITIHTSDGQQYTVASNNLPYFLWRKSYGVWSKKPKWLFCTWAKLFGKKFTYQDALRMKVGTMLQLDPSKLGNQEYAFRHVGYGHVSNGQIIFPPERPRGGQWRSKMWKSIAFAQPISADNWQLFLDSIIGKFFAGVNIPQIKEQIREAKRAARLLKRNASRIMEVQGQCFNGENFQAVAIGEKLLFMGEFNGQPRFVVDSPNYGHALYVFDSESVARQWACKEISFKEARLKSKACVIHRDGWEEKTAQALAA